MLRGRSALVRVFWKLCCCTWSPNRSVWEFSVVSMLLLVCGSMGCPAVGHIMFCIQRGWHPWGTGCLAQWGTYPPHTTCLTHSSCLGEISVYLFAFSTLGLARGLSVLLCNSEQPFYLNTPLVEHWATVGDADPVLQLSTAVPDACKDKHCLVVSHAMVYSPQKLILTVSSFSLLDFNFLLLLNFVK